MSSPAPAVVPLPLPRAKRLPKVSAAKVLRLPGREIETVDLVAVYRRMLITADGAEAQCLEKLIVSASAMREVRS